MATEKKQSNVPVITLDGPSGSGKGTIALALSSQLKWNLLNSGYIYRAMAFLAIKKNISPNEEAKILELVSNSSFELKVLKNQTRVFCEKEDITEIISDECYGNVASRIAVNKSVRNELIAKQRDFAKPPGLIAEGRDMGTVLFPNAELKIFITAAPKERAMRRAKQLKEKGITVRLSPLIDEILARDKRDRDRLESPLIPHSDSIMIDTTCLSVREVVSLVRILAIGKFEHIANKLEAGN